MKIRHILSEKGTVVHCTHPAASVKEAMNKLVTLNIGALLVTEESLPTGIITERDVLRLGSRDTHSLETLMVGDIMTRDVICAHSDDDADTILSVMTQARIRHIPIVDDGTICGLVSIGDLVKAQLQERAVTIKYLRDYITGNRT